MEINPIVHRSLSRCMNLTNVYVGTIIDKKNTKKMMTIFKEKYPMLVELSHLKRVKPSIDSSLDFIICSEEYKTIEELSNDIVISNFLTNVRIEKVPAFNPLTKIQFQQASIFWPCTFHEDKKTKELIEGKNISKEKRRHIQNYFSILNSREQSCKKNCCLVVNPKSETILATSFDCSSKTDSLQHSVMVALDMIAKLQGAGAYENLIYAKDKGRKETLAVMTDADVKQCKSYFDEDDNVLEGYLGTDLELYSIVEPCIMCSMALLHSRISRLFFQKHNPQSGGLSSVFKLHTEEGLNHHFEVYHVILKDTLFVSN